MEAAVEAAVTAAAQILVVHQAVAGYWVMVRMAMVPAVQAWHL